MNNYLKQRARRPVSLSLYLALTLILLVQSAPAQQPGATLRGRLTDAFGAAVVDGTVTAVDGGGEMKTAKSNHEGVYVFRNLAPGTYIVRVVAAGFAFYENAAVEVKAGDSNTLDISLSVALKEEVVTVTPESNLSTDSQNNADAIVLKGKDLEVLPEDPDDLAASLQALAGPSAGPNGGQVYVDGFTGARLPPKESIREVRVSSNPFNAENDQVGFGRIDILTRPGMDKFRGSASFTFNDESLNSRNPFAPTRADFQTRLYGFTLSGPVVSKKASFFLDFQRRDEDENEVINATVLDPALNITRLHQAVLAPRRFTTFSPRFDYALNQNHTLVLRYSYTRTAADNAGVGGLSLLSRAFATSNTDHNVQLTETAVLSPTMINETRAQYLHRRREQNGDNALAAINVLDAFTGGSSQVGSASSVENRWEVENNTTLTHGAHILRFGGRLRGVRLTDVSPQNFGGTFTFAGGLAPQLDANNQIITDAAGNPRPELITSIERFRRTLLFQQQGLSPARIRELGGGATQFSISGGNPEARVSQLEFGGFVQDEWGLRPNFRMTLGLRYQMQTNISSNLNFAPRVFFAWAPGGGGTGSIGGGGVSEPQTVIRFGAGIFYERLN